VPPQKLTVKPKRAVKKNKKKNDQLNEDLVKEFASDVEMYKYVVDVD
jgi:hypothetical protein